MSKGIAIETVVFAIIAVIALLVFIIFYKNLIPFTSKLIDKFFATIKSEFCNSLGAAKYVLPMCW